MKQKILMEKYPIFELEIRFDETKFKNTDEVISHLKTKIDEHPVAQYIAVFDHYSHTKSLSDGVISEDIKDAKNIICCFGKELPRPEVLAVRPRSIGVAQMTEGFVVSFLEAPNPAANSAMESWAKSIANI
ncbi:MAG: hypothetical protein IE880_08345 [Epsilonproteobacteria bacterium]|nr:hypothetical protein [Campylobacterota bacterium]